MAKKTFQIEGVDKPLSYDADESFNAACDVLEKFVDSRKEEGFMALLSLSRAMSIVLLNNASSAKECKEMLKIILEEIDGTTRTHMDKEET